MTSLGSFAHGVYEMPRFYQMAVESLVGFLIHVKLG
jgi:hypothetical protein